MSKTSLLQLMQEERVQDNEVLALEDATNTKPSPPPLHCFSISMISHGPPSARINRSIRINPLEEPFDGHDDQQNSRSNIDSRVKFAVEETQGGVETKEVDDSNESWLPITESRRGNLYVAIFHLLSSGIGVQSLALSLAFSTLGWFWGILWLSIVFIWQLYTIWLLVHLHESATGYRYSRYIQLAMASFGPKLAKLLALLPVMYLSGGTCVLILQTAGGTMQHLYEIICEVSLSCPSRSPTTIEWYLVFICLAVAITQLPNLNSIARVSLVSAITAVVYCSLIWVLPISKARPSGIQYSPVMDSESKIGRIMDVLAALQIICFAFRGHNLVLEIQGTLPASWKHPTHKIMWKGVTISYTLIVLCVFPLAISGYWTYGTSMPKAGNGLLNAFAQFHSRGSSKLPLAVVYFFLIINSLCSFPLYAMPSVDNFEFRYMNISKKPCTRIVRAGLRVLFCGMVFFLAVAVPFLPLLAPLIGGIALPLTFAYPCFMWIAIKKPIPFSSVWCLNLVLGCSGVLLSILVVIAAIWNLATKGISTNFFDPKPL